MHRSVAERSEWQSLELTEEFQVDDFSLYHKKWRQAESISKNTICTLNEIGVTWVYKDCEIGVTWVYKECEMVRVVVRGIFIMALRVVRVLWASYWDHETLEQYSCIFTCWFTGIDCNVCSRCAINLFPILRVDYCTENICLCGILL